MQHQRRTKTDVSKAHQYSSRHHKPSEITLADSAIPESLHPDLPSFLPCVFFWQAWVNRK